MSKDWKERMQKYHDGLSEKEKQRLVDFGKKTHQNILSAMNATRMEMERIRDFQSGLQHEIPMNEPEFYKMLDSIQNTLEQTCNLSILAIDKADAAQKTANWFAFIAIAVAVVFGLASLIASFFFR